MKPCEKCGLQYSSYCIGCKYEMYGLGMNTPEYINSKAERDKESEQNDRTRKKSAARRHRSAEEVY